MIKKIKQITAFVVVLSVLIALPVFGQAAGQGSFDLTGLSWDMQQILRPIIKAFYNGMDTAIPRMHADTVSGAYTSNPMWVGCPIAGFPDPAKEPVVWFDDFVINNMNYPEDGELKYAADTVAYHAGDPDTIGIQDPLGNINDSLSLWTVTVVDAAGDNGNVIRLAVDSVGGLLYNLTNDADNDMNVMQHKTAVFKAVDGALTEMNMWFEFSFFVPQWYDSEILIGLATVDTSPFTSLADGIVFRKDDGDTTMSVIIIDSGTEYETEIAASVHDSAGTHLVGGRIYGSNINLYYDRSLVKTIDRDSLGIDVSFRPTLALKNGCAATSTIYNDYGKVVMSRPSR